ncbi:receptor-like protein 12 [Gossypium australe]|uniref:Receptor-like protein 12 n=1 Tax=Gossypium australe TaxID=47621 RepID=A0A5B6ULH3_9ROSI|nr:receptor-like protein 12 [Gossypium australe]
MVDQIQESQQNMISQLTQLSARGTEKGKILPYISIKLHPSECLSPTRYISTKGTRYHKISTISSRYFSTSSGSNPGDNPTNPVVPNLDDMVEMDRAKVELPKQIEDRCKWLEEKFRAMENVDYLCGVDAKELSLVPDLVLSPKVKTPKFEKYNCNTHYP